jgi:hypothetical protein
MGTCTLFVMTLRERLMEKDILAKAGWLKVYLEHLLEQKSVLILNGCFLV